MSAFLSTELGKTANQTVAPVGYKPDATHTGGRIRSVRASFTLASQATTDTLVFGKLPAGCTFSHGIITTDTSLGTSTLAIGIAGTAAKYRAAATLTAVDTPAVFGPAAAILEAASTVDRQIVGTIGVAALPAAGNLVAEFFYRQP